MDVELYVYDLSRGVQIDAIYHTAVVFGGVEYFFGQGIHRKVPGSTHHGRPIKVVPMGRTELPREVIGEYLESLECIYTPESYDLFLHNCNNLSQDLAVFLVGKSIPEEISSLPETFLRTPMGQMLRGQLDQSMRQMTQAPDAVAGQDVRPVPPATSNGVHKASPYNGTAVHHKHIQPVFSNGRYTKPQPGRVHYPQNVAELDGLLKAAEDTCAATFFTSATCPPCKVVYPAYDQLASEAADKATLIKVDVSKVYDIATRYQVRVTPTFVTFLKGKKDQEWSGAHEERLRGNIRLLVQMASPQRPHTKLRLPSLQQKIQAPIMYTKVPPLEKLLSKIGKPAEDQPVRALVEYVKSREKNGMAETPVTNLHSFSDWFADNFSKLPPEVHFAVVDLLRIASADTRVSSFLAAEKGHRTLRSIVPDTKDFSSAPYNLQAVTVQLFCNLFGSTVFQDAVLDESNSDLRSMIERLVSGCLLAEHNNARSLAAALIYNLAAYDHNERVEGKPDKLDMSSMGDLEAALVDAIVKERQNKETLHSLLMALGLLLYAGPADSPIWDLCVAMDVRASLKEKAKMEVFAKEPLIKEIGEELLAKGGAS
ncbi:hypothetical protein LTR70_004175 [Exophiala xenobiotica]|uniref:Thioredoxin n=1 Tax=Lithohypha guttulata TaxID=1690604 RepID=A0ABR0KEG3_9EURO|nr:hypothetical protein LTR24_003657 [Lithohypha guttulata]KAK5321462.1 hypothetical protein LTR70_004175 [Exophiala xenobiotica]